MSNKANGSMPRQAEVATSGDDAAVVMHLDLDVLRTLLQGAGYRVETLTEGSVTFLRSATNGLAFDIRPGSNLLGRAGQFIDLSFVALFSVRGALPLDLVNRWNKTHRFGRLFLDRVVLDQSAAPLDFLVFCMDVSVAGGVTRRQLRTQVDLWDGLVQQLIPWLREELGKLMPTIDPAANPPAASVQSPAEPVAPVVSTPVAEAAAS
ncbi:YbjN domain-containing protein [Bradyrhizobium sp. LHD-71]|uniref:YbjN domain-containing protein n=1 Tax=Bradyrhizobium sp. LHD-71 TaxID=3072141 RepID=UPI00281077A8|nr:YbjN domain-containing protein [Bradyrhizobium sp. LHD-71]MDQ8728084.1 YbjN domain-containing protein [Bradyrhizobium sp. LHD-71]